MSSDGAPRQTTSGTRWRQLALLGGLLSVDNSEASVISVLFPAIRRALDLKLSALGVLAAVPRFVTVFAGPLWVAAAQRHARTRVLAACCGLWGVFTILAGFSRNYVELIVLVAVIAAGQAGGGPLTNGLLADLFGDRARGRAAGLLYGLAVLGVGVAGPVFGALADVRNGWRYGFFLSGTVQILFGLLALAFLRDPGVGATEDRPTGHRDIRLTRQRLKELLHNRTVLIMCLQRLTTGQFVLLSFGVTFLVDVRGFSNAQAGLVTVPVAVAYVTGTVLGGLAADWIHRRRPGSGRVMVLQASVLAYGPIAYAATQVAWKPLAAYLLLFAVLAAVQSMSPGLNRPIVISAVLPELRSAAFALMLSAEALGWALTNLLTGLVSQAFGLQTAFLCFAVILMLANGALLTAMYRPYARETAAVRAELEHRAASPSVRLEGHP